MSQEYVRVYKTLSPQRQNIDTPLADDFEDTLIKWYVNVMNTSAAATRDTTYAYRGEASLKLDTGATTPAVNNYITVTKRIGPVKQTKLQISVRFLWPAIKSLYQLRVTPDLINLKTGIIYEPYFGVIDVLTEADFIVKDLAGTNHVIASVAYGLDSKNWYYLEVGVDLETGKYTYIIINGKKYDISNYLLPTKADYEGAFSYGKFELWTTEAAQKVMNIDDYIIQEAN